MSRAERRALVEREDAALRRYHSSAGGFVGGVALFGLSPTGRGQRGGRRAILQLPDLPVQNINLPLADRSHHRPNRRPRKRSRHRQQLLLPVVDLVRI